MSFHESSPWDGRNDGPGPQHARWHNTIEVVGEDISDSDGAKAILGFASDEGVKRNKGRVGAAQGPQAIRAAMSSMARHDDVKLVDAGTISVDGEDLESAQAEFGSRLADLRDAGAFVVGLGGGHEITYASYLGLRRHCTGEIGIINIDAHFDLRDGDVATSGTGFSQIAVDEQGAGHGFHYAILGVSRAANTKYLFDRADELGVDMVFDSELIDTAGPALDAIAAFAQKVDHIYLTIDLDALPADVAPGVSAPAALGVPLGVVHRIVDAVKATGKLRVADIAEYNPTFDVDSRTARVAARLAYELFSN